MRAGGRVPLRLRGERHGRYPRLAEVCEGNETADVWTCTLREGVKFHNGADLTAHDVVTTYAHIWDNANPLHTGQSSQYYYQSLWGGFLNPPETE